MELTVQEMIQLHQTTNIAIEEHVPYINVEPRVMEALLDQLEAPNANLAYRR